MPTNHQINDQFIMLNAFWTADQAAQFLHGINKLEQYYFIIYRQHETDRYFYLYHWLELRRKISLGSPHYLIDILNLHEYTATPTVETDSSETIDPNTLPPKTIILDTEGNPRSFVTETVRSGSDQLETEKSPPPFNAYPKLIAPTQLPPKTTFTLTVGLQKTADQLLTHLTPISIPNPKPNDYLTVCIFAEGVRIDGARYQKLPLDLTAELHYSCETESAINQASISVDYIYDGQLIGSATCQIEINEQHQPTTERETDTVTPLTTPTPNQLVDLTVTIIKKSASKQLEWSIVAPNPQITVGPFITELDEPLTFANQFVKRLETYQFKGIFATDELISVGQDIAALMPPELFDTLTAVHQAINRTPTLLLRTEELLIPWEFAVLPERLDSDTHPFLAAQTVFGRWIRADNLLDPPPTELSIKRFTAVASHFGLGSGMNALPEAVTEKSNLTAYFTQQNIPSFPLEATSTEIRILRTLQQPGHLAHFAIHGKAEPKANEQLLILADEQPIYPSALYTRKRPPANCPTYTFLFLNACQVGATGNQIGQATGFPPELIEKGGTLGCIAPLWKIHDKPARLLAESFYETVLNKNQTVGEFWQQQRANHDPDDSTTPLAYLFYGHPNLRLITE